MAYPQFLIPLLLFTFTIKFSAAQTTFDSNNFLVLELTKDVPTLQYTTHLLIGSPHLPVKLVVDLAGQSLWLNCPTSSSRNFIRHPSLPCSMVKSTACHVHQLNPIAGAASLGDLTEDIVTLDGTVDRFLFSCAPDHLLQDLATGAKGMLGLGRSKVGFPSQLVHSFDFSRKFTLCLSSSDGFIATGMGIGNGISKSLTYTPLLRTSDEYYVNVKSVKINGKKLALGRPIGDVEMSTVVPYTTMKSTVYETFTEAFVRAATAMNMTVGAAVAPFGVCFLGSEGAGPKVELVLQSEMVKWRLSSMVQVDDGVMCLGVLEGGLDMRSSVVVGGYQLEDHVLEFNLGTSMLGFSSLITQGTSCSRMRALVSRPTHSI